MKVSPERKHIRLRGYDYSENGAYFITICSYQRTHLFGEIIGKGSALARLESMKGLYLTMSIKIETKRLLIRQFEKEDWMRLYAYTSEPAVMRYIPDGIYTEEGAQKFIEENLGENPEKFAVVLKSENKLIGHMYFHQWFAPQTYEIGWVFDTTYHNNGYATEAAKALIDYSFEALNLHRIIATCQPENPPSWRVAEKIGMTKEAHFRKCILTDNGWWDELFYAILEEDRK